MAPLPETPGGAPRVHTSILRRIVGQSLLLSAITILILSTLSFIVARSVTTQQRLFEQLSTVADARSALVENAVQIHRQRTGLLATEPDMRSLFEAENGAPLAALLEREESREGDGVRGITLYDADRRLLSTVGQKSPVPLFDVAGTRAVPSVDRKKGWQYLDVYSPVRSAGGAFVGVIAVRYDISPLLNQLFANLGLGATEEVTLARQQGGEIFVVHHSRADEPLHSYSLGNVQSPYLVDTAVARAVRGERGETVARDETGRNVIVAYRFLPVLQWGMVVKVAGDEAFSKVAKLGVSLALISVFLLALSGLFGFFSARKLTAPLLHLSEKIRVLGPGRWTFQRSIMTGDEVELLDHVIADMTGRLKVVYERLERKVETTTEELAQEHVREGAILESIHYGVIAVDPQGRVTEANPAALRLLGYAPEEFIGRQAVDVVVLQEKKGQFTPENHPIRRCLEDRATFRPKPGQHLNLQCKNESILPVTLMVTPLLQHDRLLGAIMVFQDVTEERQTDYMKSDFISLASHQLRTPLSSLLWYVEILVSDEANALSAEQKDYLLEIQRSSQRMANLLDTLLRVARMDEGGMVIEKQRVNVIEVLQRLAEDLKSSAKESSISCVIEMPKDAVEMSLDPVLLSIVVQNLISNAVKYSPRGSTIAFTVEARTQEVLIAVRDKGIGIPAAEQSRVFDKFFRATNIRKMTTTGTGLGLYISKRIIEDMGGTIGFESTEGEGTTFTIRLPRGN